MDDFGPVKVFYCWQSILLALLVYGGTQMTKRVLDAAFKGEENRKKNRWATEVLLPGLPLILGAGAGAVLPLHPEMLAQYIVASTPKHPWLIYAAWGAAVGQFADYLYQRINRAMEAFAKAPVKAEEAASPEPPK